MRNAFLSIIITAALLPNQINAQMPLPVDHIVYAAPDLKTGMDAIEKLLGARPVPGGRHPQYGTHNALLSLGDSVYIEVIAPDPGLEAPENGRLLQDHFQHPPHIATWVARSADIEKDAARAREQGVRIGEVSAGQREKPDGTVISWKLTDPYALPFDGAIPFLIHWGDTPHPAGAVPKGGKLVSLTIFHPEAQKIREALTLIQAVPLVKFGNDFKIQASIRIDDRIVILE